MRALGWVGFLLAAAIPQSATGQSLTVGIPNAWTFIVGCKRDNDRAAPRDGLIAEGMVPL